MLPFRSSRPYSNISGFAREVQPNVGASHSLSSATQQCTYARSLNSLKLNVAMGCLREQWGPARLIVKEFPQVTHARLTSSGRGGTNPPDRREGIDSEVEQTAQKEFVQVEVANS